MASILLVCTGNICRSPMAEGLLRAALERRFGDEAPAISSAGVYARDGASALAETVRAAAERGVDLSGHVVRRLLDEHLEEADLVLGMAAEHRDQVERDVPSASGRTFTLKEIVRLLEALGAPDAVEPRSVERLAERVALANGLRRSGFEGNPHDEDVVDPLGLSFETFRAVAWEIDEWCERLARGLFGPAAGPIPSPVDREWKAPPSHRSPATVRTVCPRCGEVEAAAASIILSAAPDGLAGIYRFDCPRCHRAVERSADRKVVALLVSAGVAVSTRPGAPANAGAEEE